MDQQTIFKIYDGEIKEYKVNFIFKKIGWS